MSFLVVLVLILTLLAIGIAGAFIVGVTLKR